MGDEKEGRSRIPAADLTTAVSANWSRRECVALRFAVRVCKGMENHEQWHTEGEGVCGKDRERDRSD